MKNNIKIPNKDIEELDLTCVIERMCDKSLEKEKNIHGGWDKHEAKKIANNYKIFLYLCYKYPNKELVPFRELDEFWHNHILFTNKYINDCNKIFGRYLHHAPSNKKNTKKDKELYKLKYIKTLELIKKEFPKLIK